MILRSSFLLYILDDSREIPFVKPSNEYEMLLLALFNKKAAFGMFSLRELEEEVNIKEKRVF